MRPSRALPPRGVLLLLALTSPALAASDPLVNFERTVIDLGPVPDDQLIKQPFRFTYTGPRWTTIKFDHCHFCPTPETDRPRYDPGQSGVVILELPTAGKHGDVEARTTVFAELDPGTKIDLAVRASVRPRIMTRFESEDLLELVHSRGGESTVTFIGRRDGFEVTSATVDSPWLEASIGDMQPVQDLGDACRAYPVRIRYKPGLPIGEVSGLLTVKTTEPTKPVITQPLHARVLGDLVAEPDHFSLGSCRPAQPFSAAFTLSRRDGKPMFYGSAQLDVQPARNMGPVVLDAAPGEDVGTLRITITGLAPATPCDFVQSFVTVSMPGPEGQPPEEIRIPLRVRVPVLRWEH